MPTRRILHFEPRSRRMRAQGLPSLDLVVVGEVEVERHEALVERAFAGRVAA